jgi:hypothetical protein
MANSPPGFNSLAAAAIKASGAAIPSAEALLYGILQLQKKIRREGTIER